jgi:Protein of unknown function (DUF4233)
MRRLCAMVLVMEAVVIGLAIPVAITVDRASPALAAVGGGLAVATAVLAGIIGRPGMLWPYVAGSVLQVVVIAGGIVVPVMFALGMIFAGLWATAIWLGYRAGYRMTG